jgi:hypothetical protein
MADPSTMTPEGWRSMETAPQDGTPILAIVSGNSHVISIVRYKRSWVSDWGEWLVRPVVWMPLPDLPDARPTRYGRACDILGWMDSEGPVTRAPGKPK